MDNSAETPPSTVMPSQDYVSVTSDGFTVSSNSESAEDIQANFESEAKPKDGEAADPAKTTAQERGKKGGEATAALKRKEAREAKAAKGRDNADGGAPDEVPGADGADHAALDGDERADGDRLGKPKDDPRARMLEATRKEAEAKRLLREERARTDELAARLERLERGIQPQREAQARPGNGHAEDADDPMPQPAQFRGDDDAYLSARVRWDARQEWKALNRQQAAQDAERQERAVIGKAADSVKAQWDKAVQEDPTVIERAERIANLVPSFNRHPGSPLTAGHVIADEIIRAAHEGKDSVALSLHLAENDDVFQGLLALPSPQAIQVEMRILARQLNGAALTATVPQAERSKAKPPVRPVTGSPHTGDPYATSDEDSFETHVRKMNALEKKERASGGFRRR